MDFRHRSFLEGGRAVTFALLLLAGSLAACGGDDDRDDDGDNGDAEVPAFEFVSGPVGFAIPGIDGSIQDDPRSVHYPPTPSGPEGGSAQREIHEAAGDDIEVRGLSCCGFGDVEGWTIADGETGAIFGDRLAHMDTDQPYVIEGYDASVVPVEIRGPVAFERDGNPAAWITLAREEDGPSYVFQQEVSEGRCRLWMAEEEMIWAVEAACSGPEVGFLAPIDLIWMLRSSLAIEQP